MSIKAIIFDIGGVLNQSHADFIPGFKMHGIELQHDLWAHENCKPLIIRFCTGKYDAAEPFFEDIRTQAVFDKAVTFEQFKQAWNASIIGLNHDLLDNLHLLEKYRLFVLSDANILHREHEEALYRQKHPNQSFCGLFEKCYFSYETGNYKGFADKRADKAWLQILDENNLLPGECLFIDDKLDNIHKAEVLGLAGLHYNCGCTAQMLYDSINRV